MPLSQEISEQKDGEVLGMLKRLINVAIMQC